MCNILNISFQYFIVKFHNVFISVGKKTALWLLPEGLACAVGAKANVPFAGRPKIVLKKCGWGINKKHRDGNECRLTRCPFVI